MSDDGESLREIPCVASESHGGYQEMIFARSE
nr:MAG TPA: hypothetical protein [Caudoviricetes sp.]